MHRLTHTCNLDTRLPTQCVFLPMCVIVWLFPILYSRKSPRGAKFRFFRGQAWTRENYKHEKFCNAHATGSFARETGNGALLLLLACRRLSSKSKDLYHHKAVRSVVTKQPVKRRSYAKFTPQQQAKVAHIYARITAVKRRSYTLT